VASGSSLARSVLQAFRKPPQGFACETLRVPGQYARCFQTSRRHPQGAGGFTIYRSITSPSGSSSRRGSCLPTFAQQPKERHA